MNKKQNLLWNFFLRMKCMSSDSHDAVHRMWKNVMSSTMKAVLGQVHLWSPVRNVYE